MSAAVRAVAAGIHDAPGGGILLVEIRVRLLELDQQSIQWIAHDHHARTHQLWQQLRRRQRKAYTGDRIYALLLPLPQEQHEEDEVQPLPSLRGF